MAENEIDCFGALGERKYQIFLWVYDNTLVHKNSATRSGHNAYRWGTNTHSA